MLRKSMTLSFESAILIYHQEIAILSLELSLMLILASCLTKSLVHCRMYHALRSHPVEKDQYTKSQALSFKSGVATNHQEYNFTYPIFILDVYVSSFLNKAFHCVVMTIAGCNMQGSLLIEESDKKCFNDSYSRLTDLVV